MSDQRIKFNFSKLSTKPSKDAMVWLGNRSVLATILLWCIYICRYLSVLQIVKECYRYIAQKKKSATKDNDATRVNVPPILPEIYFICWLAVFAVLKILAINSFVIRIMGYYYLFETFIWIIYYSIFRRFFEENYSIYHVLEYLLPLLVIFPTQALSISIIYDLKFGQAILAILGNAKDNIPNGINVMGILYAAIVIGLLVDRFPDEKIKKSEGYPVLIIGNGDVVNNRLVPALKRTHYTNKEIVKYDIGKEKDNKTETEECFCFESNDAIIGNIRTVSGENSIIWISCPAKDHVEYLKGLVTQQNKLIVCEKPICTSEEDLASVRNLNSTEQRNKIFYLSYYLLEKALPFYYFCVDNKKYLPYLECKGDLILAKNLLGKLKTLSVSIVEGPDSRDLVGSGGHLFETFIHNLLLASLICGTPENWDIDDANRKGDQITLKANYKGINIVLNQEKNRSRCERKVQLVYQNGQIDMDIDQGKMTIACEEMETIEMSIKEEYYAAKYAIQEDLVYRVASGECLPNEVDGLFHQMEVLDWLIKNQGIFNGEGL